MACENCKKLMVRVRSDGEQETICKVDGKIVSRVVTCTELEEKEQPKKVKKF